MAWWRRDWNDIPRPHRQKPKTPWTIAKHIVREAVVRLRRDASRPSTTTNSHWIYSEHRQPIPATPHVGKWLIFQSPDDVDNAWTSIEAAMKIRILGFDAKVSTAFDVRDGFHVICVYTRDWRDEADVMRVRRGLEKIGFTDTLYYKRDEDTRAGRSCHTYKYP